MIEITEFVIDPARVLDQVRTNAAGAVCLFLGTVRELTGDRRTDWLAYEAYREMAQRRLVELEESARRSFDLLKVAVVHRVGRLELGDIAVAVAVSSRHRSESFEACRWLMDTIKESVPIWKQEHYADGTEEWVHPGISSPGGRQADD
jgi:molybdopterin synthase catalytic subunit